MAGFRCAGEMRCAYRAGKARLFVGHGTAALLAAVLIVGGAPAPALATTLGGGVDSAAPNSADAGSMLEPREPEIVPDAPRPNWGSAWPGFGAGPAAGVEIPTGDIEELWAVKLKDRAEYEIDISDPIYVGEYLYLGRGDQLLQIDPKTGETVRAGALASQVDSIARMVYVDGLIVIPLGDGRLQALTADTLTTVWVTAALPKDAEGRRQQSLTTLTLGDGCVYYGTATADASSTYGGWLQCVDIDSGAVVWSHDNGSTGFYWAGAALVSGYLVIGDDSGRACAFEPKTGAVVGELELGARVRSTAVCAGDGSSVLVVSTDGVLHRLVVEDDGALAEVDSVKFAKSSTCTPVVSSGKVVVGGQLEDSTQYGPNSWQVAYHGVVAVIDLETLEVVESVSALDDGPLVGYMNNGATMMSADIQGTPVVFERGGETYVYFTANTRPGGVYRYRLGSDAAETVYTPASEAQDQGLSSIVVGPDGTLFYINDSGHLFAVRGVADVGGGSTGGGAGPGDEGSGGNSSGDEEPGNSGPGSGGDANSGGDTGGGPAGGDTGGNGGDTGSEGDGAVPPAEGPVPENRGQSAQTSSSSVKPPAAKHPLVRGSVTTTKQGASEPEGETVEDEPAVISAAEDDEAVAAEAPATAAAESGAVRILPMVGMAVGITGLAAVGVWSLRQRRVR